MGRLSRIGLWSYIPTPAHLAKRTRVTRSKNCRAVCNGPLQCLTALGTTMKSLVGFDVGFWDYATFVVLFICGVVFLAFLVWLAGLPGRIAIARKHPDAEAVKVMGYLG